LRKVAVARIITADTFNRWSAVLDGLVKKASRTSPSSQNDYMISGVEDVRTSLVICTSPFDTHVVQDGTHPNGQPVTRWVARNDTVTLTWRRERGDEFVEDLIKNIVALTGIQPEYVDEPVPGNDVEPMVERLREAREARDE
jgi:hypothetical protein